MEAPLIEPLVASLARIEPGEAAVSRLVFARFLSRALGRWVPGAEVRPATPTPAATGAPILEDGAERFCITWGGSQVQLTVLIPWAVDLVTASVLAAESWSPQVQLACVLARANAVLGGLMSWIAELGLHPVAFDRRRGALAPRAGDTAFHCQVGRHRVEVTLRCDDPDWAAAAGRRLARLAGRSLDDAARLLVPVRLVIGTRRMRVALCRSLGPGDVVLLDRQGGADDEIDVVHLVVGQRGRAALAWRCKASGREITTHGDRWMNTEMPRPHAQREEDPPPPGARRSHDPMADVEVDVHLELQVVSTPLGELAAMQPGYVLELPVAAAEACVELVVGGQVHGRAQLVRVGDRLGARILELFRVPA